MYIGDYLKQREGETWTADDTAEVMRIFREVDAVAAGMYRSATGTPCAKCGKPRTREQGSEIFTVCDDCWNSGRE